MTFLKKNLYPNFKVSDTKLEEVLYGKTILITGASFGIGRLLAEKLAFPNTKLMLTARTADELEGLCAALNAKGGQAQFVAGDLREESTIAEIVNTLKAQNLLVDVFVNNAGNSIRRSIYASLDRFHDFTRTMHLNYFAPVKLALELLPGITQVKGQIINISSVIVLFPSMPLWSAYQASKGAFHVWFKSIHPELQKRGVSCNSIYLPLVRTRMIAPTKKYDKAPAMEPEQAMELIAKSILNRKYNYKPWWTPLIKLAFKLYGKTYNKRTLKNK